MSVQAKRERERERERGRARKHAHKPFEYLAVSKKLLQMGRHVIVRQQTAVGTPRSLSAGISRNVAGAVPRGTGCSTAAVGSGGIFLLQLLSLRLQQLQLLFSIPSITTITTTAATNTGPHED